MKLSKLLFLPLLICVSQLSQAQSPISVTMPQFAENATGQASVGSACVRDGINKGFVQIMYPEYDVGYLVLGNPRVMCSITNGTNQGLVDLQVLRSTAPSIAATYLLRGINASEIPTDIAKGNPAIQICTALGGTEYLPGVSSGWVTRLGGDQNDLCVFADGSAASAWTILYVSSSPTFLGIRKNIRSKPVLTNLPYLLP